MNKIQKMIEDGFSTRRISVLQDIDFKELKLLIKKNGWKLKKEKFNEDKIEKICKLYEDGVSAKQLGIKFSIDKRRIQRWADERGKLRIKKEAIRFTYFNEHIFDKVNNSTKAYWIGFFYADAYNSASTNTISITLAGKDFEHLKKIAKFFNLPEKRVKRYTTNAGNDIANINIYSKYLCEKLSELGCSQAKSFIIKYPEWLDDNLHNHFIRGLFDGDGCLTFRKKQKEWKWSLTSTKECCQSIQNIIDDKLNKHIKYSYISKTNNNTYDLETGGNEKVKIIMDWLYKDSNESIRLDRKYNKYLQLCEQQENRSFLKNTDRTNYLLTDKQKNLKTRKKPWIGPIDFPGHNLIENDPKTIKADELLIYKGQKLDYKFLKTIDEDERDEIAKSIYNFFLEYDFDIYELKSDKIQRAWNSLKKYEPKMEIKDGVTYVNNAGTSGHAVYRYYFPNIIKVRGNNRPSIYDVVSNNEKLWEVIRNRIGNTLIYHPKKEARQWPMSQTLSQLYIGAKNSGLSSMTSIFKPTVAKAIYQKYAGDNCNVLDYSCGFGTRLLGLMSCEFQNVKYCGYEPNIETYNNLQKMINDFNFNAEIKCCGSEENNLFKDKFDLIFSSPPYFNQEKYSEESSQCYNKYPIYDEWLEKYWRNTVLNMKLMLKKNGVFGINIGGKANKFMQKLDKDMNEIIKEENFKLIDTWWMKTSRSHLVSTKRGNPENRFKLEGIFFYRKIW